MCFVADDGERVKITGMSAALSNSFQPPSSDVIHHINGIISVKPHKKRVAVLISGSGMLYCLSFQLSSDI